jgi:hypothetical protein
LRHFKVLEMALEFSRSEPLLLQMKTLFCLTLAALCSCTTVAEKSGPPAYISEAPLPQGWPTPGPYDQVSQKSYPAYRAAFTTQKGENLAFWRLFSHIKKNDIPMTAPVEMAIKTAPGQTIEKSRMAFLYQNKSVGTVGPSGETIEVRDVPASKALSYTWQGTDSEKNLMRARNALDSALANQKLKPNSYRLLGYNGPGTPRSKRTWELQAILP